MRMKEDLFAIRSDLLEDIGRCGRTRRTPRGSDLLTGKLRLTGMWRLEFGYTFDRDHLQNYELSKKPDFKKPDFSRIFILTGLGGIIGHPGTQSWTKAGGCPLTWLGYVFILPGYCTGSFKAEWFSFVAMLTQGYTLTDVSETFFFQKDYGPTDVLIQQLLCIIIPSRRRRSFTWATACLLPLWSLVPPSLS